MLLHKMWMLKDKFTHYWLNWACFNGFALNIIKQHNQRPLQGFHDCHIEWAPGKTEWCVPLGWSGSGGSNESTMVKDLSFPLMHHDPSDPGLFPDLDCSNGTHSLIWTSNLTLNWISQSAKETSFVEAWHG